MTTSLDILSQVAGLVSQKLETGNSDEFKSDEIRHEILKLHVGNGTTTDDTLSTGGLESSKSILLPSPATPNKEPESQPSPLSPDYHQDLRVQSEAGQSNIKKRKLISPSPDDPVQIVDDLNLKRRRPSVISFASRITQGAEVSVDDHFKKSLGAMYNVFYRPESKGPGALFRTTSVLQPRREVNYNNPIILNADDASRLSTDSSETCCQPKESVDEHFIRALGMTTWMRLQGR